MRRGVRPALFLLAVVALAVAVGFTARALLRARELQRRQAVAAAVVDAFKRADAEAAIAKRAVNAVPTHFANSAFFVNELTPEEEAESLLRGLDEGTKAVGRARAIVRGAPESPAIAEYLVGLDELECALTAYAAFVPRATRAGQDLQDNVPRGVARRVSKSGYDMTQSKLRAEIKADPDRVRAAASTMRSDEHLAAARRSAQAGAAAGSR